MIDISMGIKLFNDLDFFSAHDFFEDIWIEAKRDEKDFFQGLVQISVGCYHLICGNIKGAKSQLSKGKQKLEKYKPFFYKIDLTNFEIEIIDLMNKIDSNSKTKQDIPKIKLIY